MTAASNNKAHNYTPRARAGSVEFGNTLARSNYGSIDVKSSLQSNGRAKHAEGVAPTPCTWPSLTSLPNVKHCLNA
ncbi:unnamed protein product [Dovyalis caffra]|uniref:Uncharacterized protein n=1 Tax=Dovyalis caffra TaxID=77055 RepID=A0AAV1SEE8_9ROSI|nr:unnamed protein product [Dovyalis caffra]